MINDIKNRIFIRKALILNFDNFQTDDSSKKAKEKTSKNEMSLLTESFLELNFSVVKSENPSYEKLKKILMAFIEKGSEVECLACVISSNSGETFIKTSDSKALHLTNIFDYFYRKEYLRKIPKLFVIKIDRNIKFVSKEENDHFIQQIQQPRSFAMFNMYRFYSITYASTLHSGTGKLAIEEICNHLKQIESKKTSFKKTMKKLACKLNALRHDDCMVNEYDDLINGLFFQ